MAVQANNLIWIDLEMTGLEPQSDQIIEIATVVTDSELNIIAQGPMLAIHQSDSILAAMDEWNTSHHGDSGLTERGPTKQSVTGASRAGNTGFPAQICFTWEVAYVWQQHLSGSTIYGPTDARAGNLFPLSKP